MAPERTRVLRKDPAPVNPVVQMLENATPTPPTPITAAPATPLAQPARPTADSPSEQGKKQVNYRLHPALTDKLKSASIEYSYRQGRQYSQNAIVELAIQQWLDANGPWRE
jgi:hypothetical protein